MFLRGSMRRETPTQVALVTLQVLPGLEKSSQDLRSSKLGTWGTDVEQMVLVLGK